MTGAPLNCIESLLFKYEQGREYASFKSAPNLLTTELSWVGTHSLGAEFCEIPTPSQTLAMTVRAEIREGDRHTKVPRLQRGIHTHTHSTQSTPRACGISEQPTRDPAFSPSIQETAERNTVLRSPLSGLAWPKNRSAEQERRFGRGEEEEQNHTEHGS